MMYLPHGDHLALLGFVLLGWWHLPKWLGWVGKLPGVGWTRKIPGNPLNVPLKAPAPTTLATAVTPPTTPELPSTTQAGSIGVVAARMAAERARKRAAAGAGLKAGVRPWGPGSKTTGKSLVGVAGRALGNAGKSLLGF